jgi:hypothetical protein
MAAFPCGGGCDPRRRDSSRSGIRTNFGGHDHRYHGDLPYYDNGVNDADDHDSSHDDNHHNDDHHDYDPIGHDNNHHDQHPHNRVPAARGEAEARE